MNAKALAISACSTRAEADSIATALIEKRLAACVQTIPGVSSVYRWQGAVERADEVLLLIKTSQDRIAPLREAIASLHSYEVPELIVLPIVDGAPSYLAWMEKELNSIEL